MTNTNQRYVMKLKKILVTVLISTVIVIVARVGLAVYKTQSIPLDPVKVQLITDYALFGLIHSSYDLKVDEIDGDLADWYVVIVSRLTDSNDTITLHIHSPGGSVAVMIEMINSLATTKAHTISINEGIAASAAAAIAMVTDEIKSTPASIYLFHRARNSGHLLPADHPIELLVNGYAATHVFPYLTPEQVAGYLAGDDIVISGTAFTKHVNDLKPSDKRI